MKKLNKIISALLAVLMLLSSFSVIAFAEEDEGTSYEYDTTRQTLNYLNGEVVKYDSAGKPYLDANKNMVGQTYPDSDVKIVVDSAKERLDYMDLRLEKDGYRLYVDAYSGEIAVENTVTGETLFSNPYDAASSTTIADSVKAQLLSQIVVKYTDITQNNDENIFYSYTEAAERGQIDVKNIKNGIRVEYSIGREQARMLVPMMIEKKSFEENILAPLAAALDNGDENDKFFLDRFKSFYLEVSEEKYKDSPSALEYYQTQYPLLKKMDFYVIDEKQKTDAKLAWIEQMIKTYAPDYTFDDLEEDHLLTGYEAEDKNPPLFRMALEYTLDKDGLNVRLPANGIRFNETLYRLTSVDILPYMGAAASPGEGYTFFPDGSGTLFDFEKIQESGATTTVTSKVYGQDFAYHTITGKLEEEIRYPVYGMVDSYEVVAETGEEYVARDYATTDEIETETKKRGFFAIIEEGDAMMDITSYHETTAHKYNTVKVTVYPRPQDTYNVADAISVSGVGGQWTVVSSRKYTGGYRIKYIMLTPDEVAKEKGVTDSYDCSYVGMALAYRNYLVEKGVLTRLTSDDVKEDIPLYIETFGTIPTIEKFLSIPVTVMTPLTSFDDVQKMYDDFSTQGIDNINFILTGYNEDGMYSGVAYDIDWERSVGGKKGFKKLLEYAYEKEFGVYPDFDFAYHSNDTIFDSVTLRKHAVKTIDNRYANKREYSATKQTHLSFFELVISPAYFNRFYEHLTKDYKKYNPMGISVSTLGYSLNSDFDEDEPFNREDSKKFTEEAFQYLDENYDSVMTSRGNWFAWKYVDHITDIALDSSRYSQAGASVPFLGIVLHGYVQYAGEPINMEGNINYALLKAIENGAALKFIVSYRNTENLKDFEDLSKYYSIRYDIWFDDVVNIYSELNSVLASVQTSVIVNHYFVNGTRVPDADELMADADAIIKNALAIEAEKKLAAQDSGRVQLLNTRLAILDSYSSMKEAAKAVNSSYETANKASVKTETADGSVVVLVDRIDRINELVPKLGTLRTEIAEIFALEAEIKELNTALSTLNKELRTLERAAERDEVAIEAKKAEIEAQEAAIATKEAEIPQDESGTKITSKAKTSELNKVVNEINNLVSDAYKAADKMYEQLYVLETLPEIASEAYAALEAEGSTSAELLADLGSRVEELEEAKADATVKCEEVTAKLGALYNIVNALEKNPDLDADDKEGAKGVAAIKAVETYTAPARPQNSTQTPEDSAPETDTQAVINSNKYESDDNKIAYVEYENGVAFLLNFNNYAVRAEFNGKVYKIDAYDYLIVGTAD